MSASATACRTPRRHLARCLNEPIEDIDYICAGLNHVAFFLKFEKRHADGAREDLYPRLRHMAETGTYPKKDAVRFETMKQFGHFVTESSEHFAEYNSWFIKRGPRRPAGEVPGPAR